LLPDLNYGQLTLEQLFRLHWQLLRKQICHRDRNNPPKAVVNIPYKTHLAYVKERRTDTEGAKILEDALRKLRGDDE